MQYENFPLRGFSDMLFQKIWLRNVDQMYVKVHNPQSHIYTHYLMCGAVDKKFIKIYIFKTVRS